MSGGLHLEPGTLFAGRYRVERLLGEGGMGSVYEVTHLQTERLRALKVMLPNLVSSQPLRARFEREAKVGALVRSDHIVEVIDAGVDESTGAPFFVMDLLEGRDLASMIDEGSPLQPEAVVKLLGQAAIALDKAHKKGIIHRDLKPENLFITTSELGEPVLKILDFGIAKFVGDAAMQGQTQGMMGTPFFMAPEQVRAAGEVTGASDLYALAHVAYASLAGEPYFSKECEKSDSVMQLVAAVVQGVGEDACQRARSRRGVTLPVELGHWFARATHAEADRRFGTARELVEALADCLRVPRPFRGQPEPALVARDRQAATLHSRSERDGAATVIAAEPIIPGEVWRAMHGTPTITASSTSVPETPTRPKRMRLWIGAGAAGAIALSMLLIARPKPVPVDPVSTTQAPVETLPGATAQAVEPGLPARDTEPRAEAPGSSRPSASAAPSGAATVAPPARGPRPARTASSAQVSAAAPVAKPPGYVPPIEER